METKYMSESDLERMQAKWAKRRKPNAEDLQHCMALNVKFRCESIARDAISGTRDSMKYALKDAKEQALRCEFDRIHKPFRAAGTDYMWFVEIPEEEGLSPQNSPAR